jgi:hypothetical protein
MGHRHTISPAAAFLAAALLGAAAQAQLNVVSTAPADHDRGVPTAASIRVDFNRAVDRSSVGPRSFMVGGRWSGPAPGTFGFANADRRVTFTPARPFFPGEAVMVALNGGLVAAGTGDTLDTPRAFGFWAGSAAGGAQFVHTRTFSVRLPGETRRIRTYGAFAGDLNGDGAPDLALPNEDSADVRVMLGDGCGGFGTPVVHRLPGNGMPSPIEGADLDGDGDLDCVVGNIRGGSVSVLLGDGQGGFAPAVTYPVGNLPRGLALGDFDGDGDIDVVTANRGGNDLALLRNLGDGRFAAATFFEGGGNQETAVGATDADGDGILDLFVGSFGSQDLSLLLGDGRGGFRLAATVPVQGRPWMIALGDVDGDGAVDAAVCNSSTDSVSIVRGDGRGGLLPAVHHPVGAFPLAVDLGDVDADGDLDLAVSNFTSASYTLYENDGRGGFVRPRTFQASAAGSCMIVVDHDRDGDVDLLGFDELDDLVRVFEQVGSWPAGVQPASCEAVLRVDGFALAEGFGGRPPHPIVGGRLLHLGLSTARSTAYLILLGTAREPGLAFAGDLLNLDAPGILTDLGFSDARGEAALALPIPPGLPPGTGLAFQAAVADPSRPGGLRLSNPARIAVR